MKPYKKRSLLAMAALMAGSLMTALAPAPAGAAQSSDDSVKIAVIGHFSGQGFGFTEILDAVNAQVSAQNEDGGVNGKKIEVFSCDSQGDPNQGAKCARDAVDEGVVAAVGGWDTVGASVNPILEEAGIPMVGVFPSTPADNTSSNAYPITGGSYAVYHGIGRRMHKAGCENIQIISSDNATASLTASHVDDAVKAAGGEGAESIAAPFGAPDFSSYVATAISNGADCIVLNVPPTDAARIVPLVRQADPDVKIGAISAVLPPQLIEALGDSANGILMSAAYLPTTAKNPAVKKFVKQLSAENPDAPPSEFALNAWESADLFARVARTIQGEVTAENLTTALENVDGENLGASAPISFQETNPDPDYERIFNTKVVYPIVKDGKIIVKSQTFVEAVPQANG